MKRSHIFTATSIVSLSLLLVESYALFSKSAERKPTPRKSRRSWNRLRRKAIGTQTRIKFEKDRIPNHYTDDDIQYVYGYRYRPRAASKHKKAFRDMLKDSEIISLKLENIEKFAKNGILRFNNRSDLADYRCIAYVESTSDSVSLIDVMRQYIASYGNGPISEVHLVKETYDKLKFDEQKARELYALHGYTEEETDDDIEFVVNKFDMLNASGELFEIKRVIPSFIRCAFTNFLKFKDENEKQMYQQMEKSKVLLFDDFITTGNTI